jgi:hypothetical protein
MVKKFSKPPHPPHHLYWWGAVILIKQMEFLRICLYV